MMKVFYFEPDESGFACYASVTHPFFNKYDPELIFYAYEFIVSGDDICKFIKEIVPHIENELNYRLVETDEEFYELTGLRLV